MLNTPQTLNTLVVSASLTFDPPAQSQVLLDGARLELSTAFFECLEILLNRQCRNSAPGIHCPVEYEFRAHR
ncbi:hypothetical protein ACFY3G_39445 [Streptomyces phaeochromogenes]|uniref:hypothetical protein n=1 Tax=Streptomyces phaeochromogenes TaxID=1923 RepID=UPI003682FEB8